MPEMIDAKEAKNRLGCDDATLQNYVNSGSIRAQRQGGKLQLNAEDVDRIANERADDDGTIVLTGDSDDLSIDLGKVVDDSVDTLVHTRDANQNADSITFGDELEVVSFDDTQNTGEIVFDDTQVTQGGLSFTDSNTAVMTAVDETSVGGTTAPIDFQTSVDEPRSGLANGSSRRSVRSQRVVVEEEPVHWVWPSMLAASLLVGVFFILPYYVMSMFPGHGDQKDAAKNRLLGVTDNGWTSLASSVAGFSVEPDKEKFERVNPGAQHVDLKAVDPQAAWRFRQFRDSHREPAESAERFVIATVDLEAKTASAQSGPAYPIRERSTQVSGSEPIVENHVEVFGR